MAHSHSVKEYPGQLALIAGVAAAVGAGVAMVVAPKSGKETREAVRKKTSEMQSKLRHKQSKGTDTAEQAKDITQKFAKTASDTKQQVGEVTSTDTASKSKPEAQDSKNDTKRGSKPRNSNGGDMTDQIRRNGEP
jgi:gas vesicle protein